MEAKVKDQEEELDEQAGTIQMLEQVQTGRSAVQCSAVQENIQHNIKAAFIHF